MKKSRLTKILVFALSLVVLIGSAICIGASAQDSDLSVSIIKKNISNNSEIKLLFAVDDTNIGLNGEVELLYAFEDPFTYADPLNECTYYKAAVYEEGYNDGIRTYPAFITEGFPASEIGTTVYAMAHIVDTMVYSEVVRYSVMEFANERLYDDGEISDDQELLYTSLINYASMAQKLLLNGNDDLSDDITDDKLISKYVRVTVEGGKLDDTPAVATDSTFESGMYLVGDKVTLVGEGDYEVTTYLADGSKDKTVASAGAEITVGGRTVIVPKTIGAGDYFEELGGIDYQTQTKEDLKNKRLATRCDWYMSEGTSASYTGNYGTVGIIDDPTTAANRVLELYYKGTADRPMSIYMDTSYANSSNDYGCFVFETDIAIAKIDSTNAASLAATASPYLMWFELANLSSGYAPGENDPFNDAALPDLGCIAIVDNGNGGYDYYLAPVYGQADRRVEAGKFVEGKNTITFEVYGNAGKVKMFLNGNFVVETSLPSASGYSFSSTTAMKLNYRKAFKEAIMYLDNTFVGKINKTYEAE